VAPRDFEGFQQLEEEPVVHKTVCLGSSMGLEMNEESMEELVVDHSKELSFQELGELHSEEAEALKQRIAYGDEEDEDKERSRGIPAEDLTEVFSCQNKLSKLMKDYNPHTAAVEIDLNHFNNTLMAHFWKVQKSGIKQSNLVLFFKKVNKHPPTDKPPTGQSPKMSRKDDSSSTKMWFFMIFSGGIFVYIFTGEDYAFQIYMYSI
jgi:hypothetical protein